MMCTLTLEADGTALYGGNAVEAVETLQEMGAAAVGLNCSVGPDQLEAVIASMKAKAKVPIIAKPNAGMPVINEQGEAIYNMAAEPFCKSMKRLIEVGAGIIGGCCGTNPEYIQCLKQMTEEI
jgi:Methionine synthase I (cobalamin-dependent), methyltransferase domain